MNTILILMSTYQGEKYLAAQLDSIIAQTYQDWILLIRDDGSSDATLEIIKKYCTQDKRIQLIEDTFGNLKPAQSFSALMQHALSRDEKFIFFSDQDDVWLADKLQLEINLLEKLSQEKNIPVLVHSDLCVVDENLKTINPSYLNFEKLTANKKFPLKSLLIHNYITGCAMGINRALLKLACPVPENAFMHDWWCALCVAATGKIGFVPQATILYRQHGKNDTGSKGFYQKFYSFKKTFSVRRDNFKMRFSQAENLLLRLEDNNKYRNVIQHFCNLPRQPILPRIFSATRLRIQLDNIFRKLGFWFFLIMF